MSNLLLLLIILLDYKLVLILILEKNIVYIIADINVLSFDWLIEVFNN